MKNLDFEGSKEDFQVAGVFFKSSADTGSYYLIQFIEINPEMENCVCIIHYLTCGYEQRVLPLINGEEICTADATPFIRLDIWPKNYYFNTIEGGYQLYHNYDGKEDSPQGMADVINYAIKLAIEKAKITLR